MLLPVIHLRDNKIKKLFTQLSQIRWNVDEAVSAYGIWNGVITSYLIPRSPGCQLSVFLACRRNLSQTHIC